MFAKNILSAALVSCLLLGAISPSANAAGSFNSIPSENQNVDVAVFSSEFPDAYFEYGGFTPSPQSIAGNAVGSDSVLGSIEVTVFCEEAYNVETGAVIYSRLMNEEEVAEWRANGSSTAPVPLAFEYDNSLSVEQKGELTLNLMVLEAVAGGGFGANLYARGQATWLSGPAWQSGYSRPSWGEDVIALSWSNGLHDYNSDASAQSNSYEDVEITLCDFGENEFLAWAFVEQFGFHIGEIGGAEWAKYIECSTLLGVPPSDYGENIDIACTYAHSYSNIVIDDLDITIGISDGKPGGGLDISFGEFVDDWSIVVLVRNVRL